MKKFKDVKALLVNPWCDQYVELINKRFPELNLTAVPDESNVPHDDIEDVEIVISWNPLSETLPKIKKLKWFQALSAGVDDILKGGAIPDNTLLTNVAGVASVPVSEFVISYMLYFVKKYHRLHEIKRTKDLTPIIFDELCGKALGILGLGHLGAEIARKAKAFDMRVVGYDLFIEKHDFVDEIYGAGDLDAVLEASDFLVVALPLTKETKNLIGKTELRKMKKSAYLINIARAEIVEQEALEGALKEEAIAGCALDVFWSKKDPFTYALDENSSLWDMDNVVLSPHSATVTPMYVPRTCEIFFENLERYVKGENLINLVDRDAMELDL